MPVTITTWPHVADTIDNLEKSNQELVAIAEGPEGLYVFSRRKSGRPPAKKTYETRTK